MPDKEITNNEGIIFNIQRFSIHDGPGIRTTVFMKGCPLECKWCSNPESICSTPEIMVYDIKCIGCGKCKEICPEGAIISIKGDNRIDRDKCNNCMKCVEVCHARALECVGENKSVTEVIEEVERDSLFYQNSGGGVTLSGGEPLFQWRFARDLLKECKKKGFHTAIDTTGYASWNIMEKVLDYVDLVLYDIKHTDDQSHIEGTGVSNKQILENLEAVVSKSKVRTWLRFPLIQGFNDSTENIEKIISLALKLGVEKVSILPYHEWGISKYEKLGKDCIFQHSGKISDDRLEVIKTVFDKRGVPTTLNA